MKRSVIIVGMFVLLVNALIFAAPRAKKQKNAPEAPAAPAPAPTQAPVAPPVPQNPYFDGDGGKGKDIAILAPVGEGLSKDEAYLLVAAQGNFVTNFTKFSAMPVLDRVSLEKVLAESESGIYSRNADFAQLGEITGKQYVMTGKILKTRSGYSLQMQITDTKSAQTAASYTGTCTVAEIDNYTAVKKASEDLLAQMGVTLTDRGRQELLGINTQAGNAETALAKGITAQRSGTTVETLAYYYQAAAFDPSLAEAVSRASVMSADISSGNIGVNIRNDIAWRDAWVKRLTETENFFRNYIKTLPPYDLVYSTDLKIGATDYQNRTVPISFEIELFPSSNVWFDTMRNVLKTVQAGLVATGRSEAWGFSYTRSVWAKGEARDPVGFRWPNSPVSQGGNPFVGQMHSTLSIVTELVNENGISLGRQRITLPYGWSSYGWGQSSPAVDPYPFYSSNIVSFPAVKADLITDNLTIKIVSVDGVAAATVGRNGRFMITTKAEYEQSPSATAARKARAAQARLFEFKNGTITEGSTSAGYNIFIPATINGIPVTTIGYEAFNGREITSVFIPNSVTSVGRKAFDYYDKAGTKLTTITIPANVDYHTEASDNYYYYADSFPHGFGLFYLKNGKKAGTYTGTFSNNWGQYKGDWSYTAP